MHQTETVTDPAEWDRIVDAAGGHPLQLWGWGEGKASGPWRPVRLKVLGPDGEVAGGAGLGGHAGVGHRQIGRAHV